MILIIFFCYIGIALVKLELRAKLTVIKQWLIVNRSLIQVEMKLKIVFTIMPKTPIEDT